MAVYPLFVFLVFRKTSADLPPQTLCSPMDIKSTYDCTKEAARKDVWAKKSSSSLNESSCMTPVSDSIPIPTWE